MAESGKSSKPVDSAASGINMEQSNSAALVLVIGEPFTEEHKELILDKIATELSSWDSDAAGFQLNEELADFDAEDTCTEDRPNGERVLIYDTPHLLSTVLINPQLSTLTTHLTRVLCAPVLYRHVAYVGHTFSGTGHWLLQDDAFSVQRFLRVFRDPNVDACLKANKSKFALSLSQSEGDWNQGYLEKQEVLKSVSIKFNPEATATQDQVGIQQMVSVLSPMIVERTCETLLQASDVVGNIRFNRPTIYIFPGSQGNSALFGISGFNLLVDGGYSRKPCFWDFTRHLDRIDAMLLTHLGENNLLGIGSVLERKIQNDVHPEIGFVYFNGVEQRKHSPNGDLNPENGGALKDRSLVVNLVEEGQRLCDNLTQLGQVPHPAQASPTPINLYHKVGHGSLDMYVLNPAADAKELKEFLAQWGKRANNFSTTKAGIPLPQAVSVSSLVVWRPAAQNEAITRILFPGAAPYSKLCEGLDRLKSMDIFQHSSVSISRLQALKTKKPAAAGGAKSARGVKPSPPSSAREVKKAPAPEKKAPAPEKKAPTPAKPPARATPSKTTAAASPASKPQKDAKNVKKAAGTAVKKAGSTSSSKSTSKNTTPTSRTPTETPTQAATPQAASPTAVKAEPMSNLLDLAQKSPDVQPQAVPEPILPEAVKEQEAEPTIETIPKAVVETQAAPEPIPEPVKEPEPPREPTPEPPREQTPEPPREPTPEPPREPTPPPREPTPPPREPTPPPREPTPPPREPTPPPREPTPPPREPTPPPREPTPPPREPTPPPREPTPPPREPTPEIIKEPELEPVREPTPEATREVSPSPFQEPLSPPAGVPEPTREPEDELHLDEPSVPVEPKPSAMEPQQAWGDDPLMEAFNAPVQQAPVPQMFDAPVQEKEEPANESVPEFDPLADVLSAAPSPPQQLPEAGDAPPEKAIPAFGDFPAAEKDVDTAADDINANEPQAKEPATSPAEVFGGAAPEGLPSPPEPKPFDDESDSLDGEQAVPSAAKPDLLDYAAPQQMSRELLEEMGIFSEDDEEAAMPNKPPSECDLLGDLSGQSGFALPDQQYPPVNPFVGIGDEPSIPSAEPAQNQELDRDSLERDFDPLKEWGKPDGLPAPVPPTEAADNKEKEKKTRNGPTKGATKPGVKKVDPATSRKPATATAAAKTTKKPASATSTTARRAPASATSAKKENGAKPDASTAGKKPLSATSTVRKGRPSAAASSAPPAAAATKSAPAARTTGATARRTAGSSTPSKSAPAAKPTPVTPFYVDLTYIPASADLEFFRRVRARHYVLSALEPCPKQLDALLEAKGTWEDGEAEVTIIPTYDTDDLRRWMALQREQLSAAKIDIAPSASRCTIQLQDHHTSCAAYRLEF